MMSLGELSVSAGGSLWRILCEGCGLQNNALDGPGCVPDDPGSMPEFSGFSRCSSFSASKKPPLFPGRRAYITCLNQNRYSLELQDII